jgi:hypothetical protein
LVGLCCSLKLFFSQTHASMSLSIILSNTFLFFSIEFYTFTKTNRILLFLLPPFVVVLYPFFRPLILCHCCSSDSISNFKITIDFIYIAACKVLRLQ